MPKHSITPSKASHIPVENRMGGMQRTETTVNMAQGPKTKMDESAHKKGQFFVGKTKPGK